MLLDKNDRATVSSEDVTHFKDSYKKRRKIQMARFFGITIFTLITCRMAMKKMIITKGMYKQLLPIFCPTITFTNRTQLITQHP